MLVSQKLAPIEVLDLTNHPVRLDTLWQDKPVVLAFLRHFGCVFAAEQMADLRGIEEDIEKHGARLVIIGNGRAHHGQQFLFDNPTKGDLFLDPHRRAYNAAGFRRGIWVTLNPRSAMHGIRALKKGYRHKRKQGDQWQQGGIFVFSPGGRVLYEFVSREAGDHPHPKEILTALANWPKGSNGHKEEQGSSAGEGVA